MNFKSLKINEWKQFQDIEIDFHQKLTILTGANGSGKTTLLNLLSRHFGWYFTELSTPTKDKTSGGIKWISGFLKWFKRESVQNIPNNIGQIVYTNDSIANLVIHENNNPQYTVDIQSQQALNGLNIVSHRDIFKYQQVGSIPTAKRSKKEACNIVLQNNLQYYVQGNQYRQNVNFSIKETLLSWAISGAGNEFIEPDAELKKNFEDFQEILRILLPKSIGFRNITIRNYEIVLITDSGEFMIDAVSGGIASIIDIAWQIYNFADRTESFIVLIDEIENHLHPTMQRAILPDLVTAFPNVQFIISTHSPLVVGSVKDSNVYAFRYNESNRVFSEKLDLVNKAKTATEILNEVLGIPFTMPLWAEAALNELVAKYRGIEITEQSINAMRAEFKAIGLESLMPIAIKGVFKND